MAMKGIPGSSNFTRSYNSFSGVDIRATFGDSIVGTLQGISWSVTREKAPIYTMGSADPRAFARGKRGIAGSLVFIQFDQHALLYEVKKLSKLFWADKDDLRPDQSNESLIAGQGSDRTIGTIAANQESTRDDQEITEAWFSDQLHPFDITLQGANEYGAEAVMKIYGVEILNEGSGASIDDIVLEQQMTYVCRSISPWRGVNSDAGKSWV
jgi:hypothetical protein